MSVESERIKRIRKRWEAEHKISGADVTWLLEQADQAETMRAANSLRTPPRDTLSEALNDLFDGGLFGRRPQ